MEVPAMRNRWALLSVLMHLAGFGGAATAQTVDQQQCGLGDAGIDCWTAVIQSGRETPENLAKAFLTRGVLYDLKGQPDRAIEDYDQCQRSEGGFNGGDQPTADEQQGPKRIEQELSAMIQFFEINHEGKGSP
jgi:hypothetical protein